MSVRLEKELMDFTHITNHSIDDTVAQPRTLKQCKAMVLKPI
jgi:hypothetical protein